MSRLNSFSLCWAVLSLVALPNAGHAAGRESEVFTLHRAIDSTGSHHAEGTYLVPKGWVAKDIIQWRLMQTDSPLLVAFSVTSSDGRSTAGFINGLAHWYTRMPASTAAKSGGVPQPAHPIDFVIDLFRSNHGGIGVEILDRKEQPIPSIFRPMATQETRALRCTVKFRYRENGLSKIATYGFDYQAYDSGTNWGRQHGFSSGHWYLSNILSVTGPEKDFNKTMKLAITTLSSQRTDPLFFEFYRGVCNSLTQQMIQLTNEKLASLYSRTQQYFKGLSAQSKEQFAQQMRNKELTTRNICDYALDQSRWSDGVNEIIAPNTFDRIVSNGNELRFEQGPQYQQIGDRIEYKKID